MTQHITSPDGTHGPQFAFGAMQWGGRADETQSRAMYEACREAGIVHFDTAHVYTDGRSEELLGKFSGPDRDRLIIATKANFPGGGTRDNILNSFDTSRKRLGMDMVDIYYMHRWDNDTPLEETFDALAQLKQRGAIRYIGVSNYAAWQVMKAQSVAAGFGLRIDVLQPMYNLVKRQAEVELLPMCSSEGILAATYSPLGGGLLTGKYARGDSGRLDSDARYTKRYGPAAMHEAASGLAELAEELRTDPATLAAAWVAHHPSRPVPLLSARTPEQLAASLDAMQLQMDDALYTRISALYPAPPPATDRLEEA
ncbi:aldo/keto reductase [Primorskyibacter flagellatus]|uniref:aldo/keto reductase n=1 Tax=Primorskyibacter flagellatus TaxID=1387277 RepID=UPI003A90BBCC